jgi:hypothetical protein
MKRIISIFVFLVALHNLNAQQLNTHHLYKNGYSYLKLNNDTAEFKIYNNKLTCNYMKGKGTFYIEDSVIYVKTTYAINENSARFENVGADILNGKLSIEVYDQNNNEISIFNISLIGVKGKKQYYTKKCENKICEIDLNETTKPLSVKINVLNDSTKKHLLPFDIPVKSIKTNKIHVYLTDVLFIEDKLVEFHLKKDKNNVFVIGPKNIYHEDKVKFNFFKTKIMRHLYPCSDISIELYDEFYPETGLQKDD